jgi:aminobenzoyl-glutamate transport protein
MMGIGVAERSGLVAAALRQLAVMVPKWALTSTLVFAGVMSSMAADAGYVVLTPLGAVLFAGFGRHPIAGLAAAFAGVSGGFSANLLLTSLDPLLSGISTSAAQIVDPSYVVQATANYYFMVASVFLLTVVGTFVTTRIVEPRLGPWQAPEDLQSLSHTSVGLEAQEKSGLFWALGAGLVYLLVVAALTIPVGSLFHDAEHGLKLFYDSLVPLIMMGFLLCGVCYGVITRSIRSDKDLVRMSSDTMSAMGGYIVLAFTAAQFVAYFSWSNIGLMTAIGGASFLKSFGFSGLPLIIAFIGVCSVVNIFIGSASAKWAVMGPVFVPMLMMMGYTPELTQAAYRIGDSVSNIVSPLLPYFPIIITFALKYDKRAGIGTLISTMLPYSIFFGLAWVAMLIVWIVLGIPLGPAAPAYLPLKN